MKILFHEHLFDETPKEYQVEGKTWGEIIQKLQIRGHLAIYDNGQTLLYPECHDVAPVMDTVRVMRCPEDKQASQWIIGGLMTVAGAILTFTGIGSGIGVPLMLGGVSMLVGAMLIKPIEQPKDHESYEGGYNINGTQNVNAIGNVPPLVLGETMVKPPVVGTQISRIQGTGINGKQYVKFLYCLGYRGDGCLVSNIKVGDTMFATNSGGVTNGTITVDGGLNGSCEIRQDGTLPLLYDTMCKEQSVGAEIKLFNEMQTNFFTTSSGCESVTFSVIFQGLYIMRDDGSLATQAEAVRVYMRPSGTQSAFVQVGPDFNFQGNRNKQYTFQRTVQPTAQMVLNNPSKQWDVVICKAGIANSNSSKVNAKPYLGFIQYQTIREPMLPEMYNKLVLLACEFEATNELQSRLAEVSCVVKNKYHIYQNGNWNTVAYSSNPAAIYRSLLKGNYLPRQATDDQIDYATLNSLYQWCDTNQRTCNTVISSPMQLRELLNNILFTCQGSFYLKNGLYSVSFDKEQSSPVALLIPKNTSDFRGSKVFGGVIDALECTFNDKNADYKETTELVLPYGATTYTNKQSQKMFGTDNYAQAVKIARYIMACNKMRPETYTLKIGIEHYSIPRGSRVLVQHDVLKVGICSGRINSVYEENGSWQIELDEIISPQSSDQSYSLVIFKSNGDIVTVGVYNPSVDTNTLTAFDQPTGVAEGDLYAFGVSGLETIDCIVSEKKLNDDMSCELTLIGYDNNVYTATNAVVPDYNPKVFRGNTFYMGAEMQDLVDLNDNLILSHFGNIFYDFGEYAYKTEQGVTFYENRGSLRELSKFTWAGSGGLYVNTSHDSNRNKDIDWICPASSGIGSFFVDNLFWKNTTVSFMAKNWAAGTTSTKQIMMSYVDVNGKNYFEIYSKNSNWYISSQLIEIQLPFNFATTHMITITRDWTTGVIRVWQDTTQVLAVYFTDTDYAITDEGETNVLANEAETAVIVIEPSVVNRGALDRTIKLYLWGNSNGSAYDNDKRGYLGDIHIWDWALEQEDVENVYYNSTLTMKVDRLTRYLGGFKDKPTLARVGDSFMWLGVSGDEFENGKVYWLTTGGWSILNNNAEYSVST